MTGHGLTSAFAADLEDYLDFKQGMGFHGKSRVWYLKQFDAYCAAHNASLFDRDTVEGWVTERVASCGRYRSWMSYIRDVGRWMRAHGHPEAYVLSDRWKAEFVPAHPYLMTWQEIQDFFTAATGIKANSPWQWQAAAFFTLMHSCGLRTGEVRALSTDQVDLKRGQLDVIWSKGNRSRRLPLTDEVREVLSACDRASRHHLASRGTFFISGTGNPVPPATPGVMFNRIWDQAGLPRPVGGQQPRPYDFRHHFAYANIERWMAAGQDVAAMLPYLSRYMGHASFDSTYYYVHTSPDFMHAYADIARTGESVLPEVGFA